MELDVRRGIVILTLGMVLLASGLLSQYLPWPAFLGVTAREDLRDALAASLLTAAAVIQSLGLIRLRRGCRALTAAVREAPANTRPHRVDLPHPDLNYLCGAINELIDGSQRAVAQAMLQVKELEIQLKVATAERQHAEAIIYSISDAVLVTDTFDELVLANESAARTFDFDLSQSNRAPVDQVVHDPKMIDLIREMRQSDSRSGRRIIEHRVKTVAGDRTYKVTFSCVTGQDDTPAGVVAVLHDMTKEKEVAEMKNDFVSNVSHELRTPLASIRAYIEMLIDGEAEDEKTKTEFYEIIQNEANRLGRLIDNILNISRIESGLVKVNKQPQSLMVILKEAIEVIAPQAKQKQIILDEQLPRSFIRPSLTRTCCTRRCSTCSPTPSSTRPRAAPSWCRRSWTRPSEE